jgi:putative zinc finger/helix-turn-helix YgiT family protein
MKKNAPICFHCNEGGLAVQPVNLIGERYGEKFSVTVQGLRCDNCDYQTITNRQSGDFTKAVSDAYRQKHGLLTGDQIRELRGRLGMNQLEFAEYLGVGSSSVKRWEGGQVQEKGNDELIRLKTDSERAKSNYESLEGLLSGLCADATIVFDDADVELSHCSGQTYYRSHQVSMDVDMSEFDTEEPLREPVAA